MQTLCLYDAFDPEREEHEYGKSIFDSESETVSNIGTSQKVKQNFEVDSVKCQCNEEHVDDLSLHDTSVYSKDHYLLKCKLDITEVKQSQGQDMHLSKIIKKCKPQHHYDKTLYFLSEPGITYRKIRDGLNIFYAIMVPKNLQCFISYKCHNALRHNGPTRLYIFFKRYYYWKKLN